MIETRYPPAGHSLDTIRLGFDAFADLYYAYWGEFFHLALFEEGEDVEDFPVALERTHQQYFQAIDGQECMRIVDLACGGGAFSAWLADHSEAEVVGVDLSKGQLDHARKRHEKEQQPNLSFVQQDITDLAGLDLAPFDGAVCLDAACYLPDRPRTLRNVASKLQPGARLLWVDWCRSEESTALQRELIMEPFYRSWGITDLETIYGYERAFEDAGFDLLKVDDLSDHVTPNWERAYRAGLQALAEPVRPRQLLAMAVNTVRYRRNMLRVAKDQFYVALLSKAAADAGLLRYVSIVAERR